MKHKKRRRRRVIEDDNLIAEKCMLAFFVISLTLSAIFLPYFIYRDYQYIFVYKRTVGHVIDSKRTCPAIYHHTNSGVSRCTQYKPVVEYFDDKGIRHEFTSGFSSMQTKMNYSGKVTVLYTDDDDTIFDIFNIIIPIVLFFIIGRFSFHAVWALGSLFRYREVNDARRHSRRR